MMQETIEFILTGGRLEKVLNEDIGRLVYRDSAYKQMLIQAHCTLNIQKHILMLKESAEINETDLESIASCCSYTAGKRVIVAHGVSTMIRTAQYLKTKNIPKTIVLFGAFVPYALQKSDAMFNFGMALSAVQLLPHGVYIAMNGQIIDPDQAKRDPESGTFYCEGCKAPVS